MMAPMSTRIGLTGVTPITPADVAAAESRLGFPLPAPLVAFCLTENGGMPERCWLIGGERDLDDRVDWFLPTEPVSGAEQNGIVSTYLQLVGKGLIPADSIPFARDAGCNFFLLDRDDRRVWFMPMDEWEDEETSEQNWARSGCTRADSFKEFLDALSDEAPDWARD